jgi:hypothetical protein
MTNEYKRVKPFEFEDSGLPAAVAVAFPWATATATAAVTATATVAVYYVALAPVETAVKLSCAALPTCAQLGVL